MLFDTLKVMKTKIFGSLTKEIKTTLYDSFHNGSLVTFQMGVATCLEHPVVE